MSILLDALKRAEQEKQAKQGTSTPEPPPAPAAPVAKLELESIPKAPVAEKPAAQAERDAAMGVFTAKQVPVRKRNSIKIAAIAGIIVLVIVVIAGYFWWEWNRLNKHAVAAPAPARVAAPSPPPVAPAAVDSGKPADPVTAAAAPGVAAKGVPPVATSPAIAPLDAPKTRPQPQAAEAAVMNLLREGGAPAPSAPLKMTRSIDPPRVNADVAQGYDALKRGDFAEARRAYEAAQATEPLNVDAQLGLGTIAARAGDRNSAARHFRRALEIDPKNAGALAGLASLSERTSPEQLEAELRGDITRYPHSAALQMALGNLYASQRRWSEAQQSFFEAFRLDPESADASYNLAVSLDHLGQARPAVDYYQRSLALSQKQAVQFDREKVRRRVEELRP